MYLLVSFNMTPLIVISCIAIVVLILCVVGLVVFLKRRTPKIRINQEFMHQLLTALGSIDNVKDAKTMNGRVILEVEDIEKVTFDTLKELSTKGVFITNQTIKMLFPYDSETISKEIKDLLHTK
ncbi:MAG: hypothetical protein HFG90_03070 [Acholeplasmatales bacterium]|jgi:phosphotransferase system IIB component|nr:hypothetical protein [Acholeplasmatales bacterium]